MVWRSDFRPGESCENLAVFDPVEGGEIHRRLAVFGRHNDRGAVEKPVVLEGTHHTSKGLIDEVERVFQDRPGSRAIGEAAACGGSRRLPSVLEVGSFWAVETVWKFMPKIAGVPGLPEPSWRCPLIQLMTA
jgi:hypothetical protein